MPQPIAILGLWAVIERFAIGRVVRFFGERDFSAPEAIHLEDLPQQYDSMRVHVDR